MQNGKKKVLALLLAGCCVLSACGTKTDDTKTAEKGNFVTGTVECKEVYVRAKIPGYLTDIPVEEGQEVKVKVIGIDESGRINLSIKKAMDPPPRPAGQGRAMGGSRPGSFGGVRKAATAEPATFEDRLKQFMASSDSKLSELRQSDRRSSRRGGRK